MKKFIAALIRAMFRVLPIPVGMFIVRLAPILFFQFPKDREVIVPFLGRYRMHAQSLYGIECEMVAGYEPDLLNVIRNYVRPGMTVLDVGANVGVVTVFLADRVGLSGKVVSFEPNPAMFARMQRNIDLNPSLAPIIVPCNMGCGEKAEELLCHEFAHARGNSTIGELPSEYQAFNSWRITVTPIDDFVESNHIGKIDFMKIDVEGMEYPVLLGARKTLLRDHPAICCEVAPSTGKENFRRFETLMNSLGYDLFRIDGTDRKERADEDNFTLNTLALKSEGRHSPSFNSFRIR